jgi:phosphatidate cytidylyltransferase
VSPQAGAGGGAQSGIVGDLKTRAASAVVLAAIGITGVWLGGIWMAIVAAAATAIVHWEWTKVTGGKVATAAPFGAAVIVATLAAGLDNVRVGLFIAVAAAALSLLTTRGLWAPAGVVYASALGIGLVVLRSAPELGTLAVIFLFAVVWATDTGAYFAGRVIGGPKLAPVVSPKKTWSGAIGGLVAALVAGLAVIAAAPETVGSLGVAVVAIVLSIGSQIGDLFESWVKRRFGVKDASHLIPGHGGLMDRVDGLIFAAVIAVLIGLAHGGPEAIGRGLLSW